MNRILALTKEKKLIREIERVVLDDISVDVEIYTDMLEFIENLHIRFTQLVILDIDLLQEKINKLISVIRSIRRDCKIILILSQKNMDICSSALQMGIVSYLIKPVSVLNVYNIILSAFEPKTTDKKGV